MYFLSWILLMLYDMLSDVNVDDSISYSKYTCINLLEIFNFTRVFKILITVKIVSILHLAVKLIDDDF